jgi:hypothetical protein
VHISYPSGRLHALRPNTTPSPATKTSPDSALKPLQTDPAAPTVHAVAAGSSMAAISFSRLQQCGQCSMSNTRFPTINFHLNGRFVSFE